MPVVHTFLEAASQAHSWNTSSSLYAVLDFIWAAIGSFFAVIVGALMDGVHYVSAVFMKPEVQLLCVVWFVVFWIMMLSLLLVGFGPGGVIAGSLAAAFQSWMYGGFTPAGGAFAVLTSIGMMGVLAPQLVTVAVPVASGVTLVVALARGDFAKAYV